MEQISELGIIRDDEEMEMPPGFRFHPTDEELISHYLAPKVLESNFTARAIGEVDLNKVEPWDLHRRAKNIEESEWYFFCVRDRKYPTGLRTNRATKAGYWKATGKDKEIYKSKTLVGMKKTLVFYQGRAPKGEKTDWVMHEYRLEGKSSPNNLPRTAKIEWVISKVFHKSTGGKKILISGLDNQQDELEFSNLPTLTDWSSQDHHTKTVISTSQMTCFSDHSENKKTHENIFSNLNNSLAVSKHSEISPVSSLSDSFFSTHYYPNIENFPCPDSAVTQDQFFRKIFLQNNNFNMNKNFKMEFSPDTGINTEISSLLSSHETGQGCYDDRENGITSIGLVDFDCFWNY